MLISDTYRQTQTDLHAKGNYGVASVKYAHLVTEIINKLEVTHLLDYGCGRQMNLIKHIKPAHKLTYQGYDPAIPDLAGAPIPAQMVACIDVLEHIEPEFLDNVLDHLASLTEVILFATVHTGPAGKVLSDGRNAHLIQQPMEWWLPQFMSRWDLQTSQVMNANGFYVICYAKPRLEATNGEKLVQ